jgi:hypothetical protein
LHNPDDDLLDHPDKSATPLDLFQHISEQIPETILPDKPQKIHPISI